MLAIIIIGVEKAVTAVTAAVERLRVSAGVAAQVEREELAVPEPNVLIMTALISRS